MEPLIKSPLVAKAAEENPVHNIPPNTTSGEWVRRRLFNLSSETYTVRKVNKVTLVAHAGLMKLFLL